MKKLKYIPIESIGSNWLIYKDWSEDAIYLLIENKFHPINFSLSSLPLNISSELMQDFKIYHSVWEFSLYDINHPVRKGLVDILKNMRIKLAIKLFKENPFINTFIESDIVSYDSTSFWWNGFQKINSGEKNMKMSYEEFKNKNKGFIIGFDHLATPFWDLESRANMSLSSFEGWIDSKVLEKLITMSMEWESAVNEVELENWVDIECEFNKSNKPKLMQLAKKIKLAHPDIKIYIHRSHGETMREFYELEEIVI